jgi:hypothetical protein
MSCAGTDDCKLKPDGGYFKNGDYARAGVCICVEMFLGNFVEISVLQPDQAVFHLRTATKCAQLGTLYRRILRLFYLCLQSL